MAVGCKTISADLAEHDHVGEGLQCRYGTDRRPLQCRWCSVTVHGV